MVKIIGEVKSDFESGYLKVREKEQRIYNDQKVSRLPYLSKGDAHANEWKLRAKSMERFLYYLNTNHKESNLLEIGCGNGWFVHHCSKRVKRAIGVDINLKELEQAARVFERTNLTFYYWDIFTTSPFEKMFDCIVLNAVVQYFPNFGRLIDRLKELLVVDGEIHIIDSPFYQYQDVESAKKRTRDYYSQMGVPEMANFYFHHSKETLRSFSQLYTPSKNKFKQIIVGKDSPFGWYVFRP